MTTGAERDRVKEEQRDNWNAASTGWTAAQDAFETGARTITDRLIELAGVRRGQVVLDIGTGHGEPALSVASIVGPDGLVVGVDIAAEMLAIARERAKEAGVDWVEFVEGDVERLGQPAGRFDAAVSRLGLMFAIDHRAAFEGIADVLTPGGVLTAAVWHTPDRHLLSTGPAALSEALELPQPPADAPGPYSMADPDRLTATLSAAGFAEISVEELVVPFRFPSAADYAAFNRRALPPGMVRTVIERLGEAEADRIMMDAVRRHTGEDGSVSLPSTALCLRAVRPA